MPNRLVAESSPYLLQHANNPVDWYPWGPEALERAKQEQRPIFLSIGYSACHWCHVMEHESFENPQIAAEMNRHFISIKVDREERPDLDHLYMTAVQALTGRGGWPMSVFLTPELEPLYGGTYWPPQSRQGMPGFDQVLHAVADAWQHRRDQATDQAGQLADHVRQLCQLDSPAAPVSAELISRAVHRLDDAYDRRHGGFGGAPKFPHPMDLRLLLRAWQRTGQGELLRMVSHTLDQMARGGMYDQLGGGFHRYSVDDRWLVPHFEKMLYDNALLTTCYLEAYQATGEADLARVARETCDYVLREMTHSAGGFFGTQDADSEGEEGKFYVWTPEEITAVLGPETARTFCTIYDVRPGGNFEGHSILNLPQPLSHWSAVLKIPLEELRSQLDAARAKLLSVRNRRVWPGLDDKVLVSWNGLMIEALALASAILGEPRYAAAAAGAATFLQQQLRQSDGRLRHTWRDGQARLNAYLDDYAALVNALVTLYEATGHEPWIDWALDLAQRILAEFQDPAGGGFYFTGQDHEQLLTRFKDLHDASVPSGNSLAVCGLLRLGRLTGRTELIEAAIATLQAFAAPLKQHPGALGQMLLAVDLHLGPSPELVLLEPANAPQSDSARSLIWQRFLPRRLLAWRTDVSSPHQTPPRSAALEPVFAGKTALDQQPTLYLCQNFACQEPQVGREAIEAAVAEFGASPASP